MAGVVVAAHGAANLEDSYGERGFFGRKTAPTCVYERERERERAVERFLTRRKNFAFLEKS